MDKGHGMWPVPSCNPPQPKFSFSFTYLSYTDLNCLPEESPQKLPNNYMESKDHLCITIQTRKTRSETNWIRLNYGKMGTHRKILHLRLAMHWLRTALTWLGTTHAPPHSLIIGWESPGSPLPIGHHRFLKHLKSRSILSRPPDSTWVPSCSPCISLPF
jgi:hypothetical protein